MKIKSLQQRKALRAALIVLLIVAGLTKLQAQNITFFSKTEQNYIEIRFQTDEWLSRFGLVMVEVRAIC